MTDDATNEKQTFSMKELKCEKVVVYTDRAEVQRSLRTTLKHGESELVINNVTQYIDHDSVRVEGHGSASVLDVICQTKRVAVEDPANDTTTTDRVKQLQSEIKELEVKAQQVQLKLDRIKRQQSSLNEFANTLAKPTTPAAPTQPAARNTKDDIDNFMGFLDTYERKLQALDEARFEREKEMEKLNEQLSVARDNLNKLNVSRTTQSTEITILIETREKSADIELKVSYVVYNASWTPKYDIRVFSKDKSMIINYFGMITQSTHEDWNDTKLSLSTAVPSVGGNVPELETQNVRIKPKVYYNYGLFDESKVQKKEAKSKQLFRRKEMAQESEKLNEMAELDYGEQERYRAPPSLELPTAKVEAGITSTTFDIPRAASIPADNNTHKVSIGIINLKPDFEYEVVPKKNVHAFIKAKVKNTSDYAMLAGPANVFFDNNFVAKTQLKSYSPQEEFTCSLGVDPAIRIDYKPLKKFKGQSGLLSKTTTTTYEQAIEIKNTTPNAVKLLLSENLPLSNDDKIQVKLLEPSLKNNATVKLNKSNNLEFDLHIPSGRKEELLIKYSIDHPANEEIDFF